VQENEERRQGEEAHPWGPETVHFTVPRDLLRKALALAQENRWSDDEALRIVFAYGVSYLLGERRLREAMARDHELAQEVQRLTDELMTMHSMYAVMKFRAFTLEQEKQALELRIAGLEGENRMYAQRLAKFRQDEEALRAEIATLEGEKRRLEAENRRLREQLMDGKLRTGAQERRGVLRWLRGRWGGPPGR
jgi:hypothetical protein